MAPTDPVDTEPSRARGGAFVVTRDPALAQVFASVLTTRGHATRTVPDYEAMLAAFAQAPAELVVLDERDLVEPFTALARLRQLAPLEACFALVLTGDEGRAEGLIRAGASDFLIAPFSPAGLVSRLTVVEQRMNLGARGRHAEQQLRESHRTIATLIGNLPGMVYRCNNDRDWSMQFISEGCVELTGYPADDFLKGRVVYGGLIHHEDRDKIWDVIQEAIGQRRPFRLTYRIHTATGESRWLWEQGQGVYTADGQLVALEGFITDLSELRRTQIELEEREVLLETLLAVTTTAYILVDHEQTVAFVNLAAQTWLKLPDSRLIGTRFTDVLASMPQELRDAVARGRDSIFTVDHQSGDFEAYHLVMRNVQMGGKPHTAYAFKRLTRELARQEVEVWKKVIRLIAHEINNTLAPISSLLHSARLINAAEARDARLDRIIDTISERSKHLGEFLKGYTQFARLPRPRLEPVKWRTLFDRLEDLVQYELDAAPEDLNTVSIIDRSQIEQALINLLKNAVEAGGPPEAVALRLRCGAEGDEIQVLDRGPGIPPELLSKVLLPFYSTKRTGSGLGLPLCREIVEAHGGNLRIEAREDGGTAVIIWLPRLPPP